jgi:hypothetical protein
VYLLFAGNGARIGLIAGVKDGVLRSPFSAPFGGFTVGVDKARTSQVHEAVTLLDAYVQRKGLRGSRFVLTPRFYDDELVSATHFALAAHGHSVTTDINHHFRCVDFDRYERREIKRTVLQNIDRALSARLEFRLATGESERRRAVEIIGANRASKGRPPALGHDELADVARLVPVDFFLVWAGEVAVASAVVYHVAESIVQIIYWGDLPGHGTMRPMNLLAFRLFEHYSRSGMRLIDLATSSVAGTPNLGLCDFKENIGCTPGLRHTFERRL